MTEDFDDSKVINPEEILNQEKARQQVVECFDDNASEKEVELALLVTDLVYETRFEKFPITEITSVKNTTVGKKADLLFSNSELRDRIIPAFLMSDYPVQYDDETIPKAPWVNMIHAWTKVLNELNTVSAMQKGEIEIDPKVLADCGYKLYKFTTDSDGNPFVRTNEDFLNEREYVETKKRKAGTKGVNSKRHVCFEEMKYILKVVKETYYWGE